MQGFSRARDFTPKKPREYGLPSDYTKGLLVFLTLEDTKKEKERAAKNSENSMADMTSPTSRQGEVDPTGCRPMPKRMCP